MVLLKLETDYYTQKMPQLIFYQQQLRILKFNIPNQKYLNFHEARLGPFCKTLTKNMKKIRKMSKSSFMKISIFHVWVKIFSTSQRLWVKKKFAQLFYIILCNSLLVKSLLCRKMPRNTV